MSKLYTARSLLYRRQFLQVLVLHTCSKALDEIHKIYMLLHRSDLNISAENLQKFADFQIVLNFLQTFAFSVNL